MALVARDQRPEEFAGRDSPGGRQLDANLPVFDAKTMREHRRLSLFPLRTGAWTAGSFALLALLLAGLDV